MHKFSLNRTLYRWRIRTGFIGLILAIVFSNPDRIFLVSGFGVCLVGLLLRTWAAGHLRKEKELAVSGPYRYTRNPLYLANFIIGISVVLASHSIWIFILFIVYFLLFYLPVISREKERMESFFPAKYEDYKKKVPLFFPSLKPYPCLGNKVKFDWKLYKRNREYRALLGALLFWILMLGKAVLVK